MRINRRAALPSRFFKTRGPKPTENNYIPPNRNAVSRSDICSIESPFSSIVGEVRFWRDVSIIKFKKPNPKAKN